MLRRIRAALVVATLWGLFWGVVTMGFFQFLWQGFSAFQREKATAALELFGSFALGTFALGAVLGMVTGVFFSILLATLERRRGNPQWSYWRFAAWGGIAAAAMAMIPVLFFGLPLPAFMIAVVTLCGVETAVHTAFIVRRAPPTLGEQSLNELPLQR